MLGIFLRGNPYFPKQLFLDMVHKHHWAAMVWLALRGSEMPSLASILNKLVVNYFFPQVHAQWHHIDSLHQLWCKYLHHGNWHTLQTKPQVVKRVAVIFCGREVCQNGLVAGSNDNILAVCLRGYMVPVCKPGTGPVRYWQLQSFARDWKRKKNKWQWISIGTTDVTMLNSDRKVGLVSWCTSSDVRSITLRKPTQTLLCHWFTSSR